MVDGAASHVWLHEDRIISVCSLSMAGDLSIFGQIWWSKCKIIQAQSFFLGKVLGFSNGSWSFLIIIPVFLDDGLQWCSFGFGDLLKLSIPTVSKCHGMFSMGDAKKCREPISAPLRNSDYAANTPELDMYYYNIQYVYIYMICIMYCIIYVCTPIHLRTECISLSFEKNKKRT